jgi:hypothetical protein
MAASQTTTRPDNNDVESTARDIASATRDVATEVADRANAVASRLPEAAATTRSAAEEAVRRMEAGTDEMLAMGASLAMGLAIGMLVGGAPRILVAVALVPATAMGFTLLNRSNGGRPAGRRAN